MQLLVAVLLLFAPSAVFSATVVDLSQIQLSSAESSGSSAPTVDLGKDSRRGVEAWAQLEPQPLLDVSEPLGEALQHYLISVVFRAEKTGNLLVEGQVAARTFTPESRVADTVRLEPQEDQWFGSLVLPLRGETMIKIGCKLADGKKRIYRFFFNPLPVGILPEVVVPAG